MEKKKLQKKILFYDYYFDKLKNGDISVLGKVEKLRKQIDKGFLTLNKKYGK